GCGTCAESTIGGVSCTGDGEAIIRVVLGRRVLDYLTDADDPDHACRVAVDLLVDEGRGQGGLIVVDWRGRTAFAHSTPLMPLPSGSPWSRSDGGGGNRPRPRAAARRDPGNAVPLLPDILGDDGRLLLLQAGEPPDHGVVQGARRRQPAPAAGRGEPAPRGRG